MRSYFARIVDKGIEVRFVETHQMVRPEEWKPVPNVRDHVNAQGLAVLGKHKPLLFTQADQSYPALAALFSRPPLTAAPPAR